MKTFRWDEKKNLELTHNGRPNFEDLLQSVANGNLVDDTPNLKYPNQRFMWVWLNERIHLVAYEDRGDHCWLATAFPSRLATKMWKNKKMEQDKCQKNKT